MFSDISIIIPYKDSSQDRREIFEFVINRYKILMPDAEICIGCNDGEFNQAGSLNDAIRKSTRKYLLIMDSDVLINPDIVEKCIEMMQTYDVVFTHDLLIRLSDEFSKKIINENILIINQDIEGFEGEFFYYPINSICMIKKELLNRTGCFDERFEGWGYTDTSFRKVLFKINAKVTTIKSATIYHLNHTYDTAFKNDFYLNNNYKIHSQYYNDATIYQTIDYLINKYNNL